MSIQRARQLRKTMPAPELKLWNALRTLRPKFHFRRQAQIGPYYADVLCHHPKLVIEVDGESHFQMGAPDYDRRRDARMACDGYAVRRFSNDDVMQNLDGVMTAILMALEDPHP